MTEPGTTAGERGQRIGETFGELSEQIAALVRDELQRTREDLVQRAREAGKAGGYLGAATVFGLAAAGAALSLPALVLRRLLPAEATAVAVGGLYGGVALVLARRALERLQEAAPEAVERRIEETKGDLAGSLRERVPGAQA